MRIVLDDYNKIKISVKPSEDDLSLVKDLYEARECNEF